MRQSHITTLFVCLDDFCKLYEQTVKSKLLPKEGKREREVVKVSVKQNGSALQYTSKALRGDPEIVAEAVAQDWRAAQFALTP